MTEPETTSTGVPPAAVPPAALPPSGRARHTLALTVLYATVLVVAWALLELAGLGNSPFHTKGEPREALVVWEMTHGGGWILPRRNGVELPSKPPLFHWLGALTSLARGATDEWSIRFPSVALSGLSLLAVFAAGCALWNPRAGLVSALALMTTFEWARAATNARVDMTLTFGLLLAFLGLLFFLRTTAARWLVVLYAGMTLAVLGKGPVGAALPALVALAMFALHRDFDPVRRMRLLAGTVAVAVGAGTWYALALLVGGQEFFRKQILGENLFTFLDEPEFRYGGHRHPAWYLLGALVLGLLPWTPFFAGVGARLWRERSWRGRSWRQWREGWRAPGDCTRADPRLYLLVWIAVVFGFYAVAASKRSVYLLALYPAAALLLGWWWDEHSRAAATDDHWLGRLVVILGRILLTLLGLVFALILVEALGVPLTAFVARWLPPSAQPALPWISTTIRSGRWPLLGSVLIALAAQYAFIRAGRAASWMAIFASLWLTSAALTTAVRQVILPGIAPYTSVRRFMTEVRRVVGPDGDLFFYKAFDYGAVFYWQGHIRTFEGEWPDAGPPFVLTDKGEWERTRGSAGDPYEEVRFPGASTRGENGELVFLRRRDPASVPVP